MRNSVEIAGKIGVNDFPMPRVQQPVDFHDRAQCIPSFPIGMLFCWQVGLEDRPQDQYARHHAHPIVQARNSQRPQFAVRLRYIDTPDRFWSITLLSECLREFPEPPLLPIVLDVLERLSTPPRRSLVGSAASVGE